MPSPFHTGENWTPEKLKTLATVLRYSRSLRPTLCDPTDCSPPGSSAHGHSPGQNTGVDCHALLQGNLPNPGILPRSLPQCRQILYWLSHQGSPRTLEWVSNPSSEDLPDQEIKPGSSALQVDSLPAELPGKPTLFHRSCNSFHRFLRKKEKYLGFHLLLNGKLCLHSTHPKDQLAHFSNIMPFWWKSLGSLDVGVENGL